MRDYKKENNWLKENYCRIEGRLDKRFGEQFKLYLKSKNKNFNLWLEEKIKEDGLMKIVGSLWNDKSIQIIEQDGEMYALYGWNGDSFNNCWKVLDKEGIKKVDEDIEYTLKPISVGVGEPDENGDYDEYKDIAYEISKE